MTDKSVEEYRRNDLIREVERQDREWKALNRREKRTFHRNVQLQMMVIIFLVGAIVALLLKWRIH